MKNEKALKQFKVLQKKMDKDKDPYMFVHFSREEDYFKGLTSKEMDRFDAMIVIKHLINRFNINTKALSFMRDNKIL